MFISDKDTRGNQTQYGDNNTQIGTVQADTVNFYVASNELPSVSEQSLATESVESPLHDFRDLSAKLGEVKAREIFNEICLKFVTSRFSGEPDLISSASFANGTEVTIGKVGKPVEKYHCEFFADGIDDSQKEQICSAFDIVTQIPACKTKRWVLCVPCILSLPALAWWSDWRNRQQQIHIGMIIDLYDLTFLLNQTKRLGLLDSEFDEEIRDELNSILASSEIQHYRVQAELMKFVRDTAPLDYQDAIFVKKLESALVKEIDGCKRDFFSAELSEYTILSKRSQQDKARFEELKAKVLSLWDTQYRRYQHDTDGNDLLTRVYERIEDLDSTTLATPLTGISLFAKHGFLHQFAEECSVGWIADYKAKLEAYLKEANTDAEQ